MLLDHKFLEEHSSYRDGAIEERAFLLPSGDGRCLAILHAPAAAVPRPTGFVICHSYGPEVLTLRRAERMIARALANEGYPVLSFHRRGYGDSSHSLSDATLEWHLEDVHAAVEQLHRMTGVSQTGLVGARFGGLVAGLYARHSNVDRLFLMNPVVNGGSYARSLIRDMQMVHLASTQATVRRPTEDLLSALQGEGKLDIMGYDVHWSLFASLAEVDLRQDIGSFAGDCLIGQVSQRSAEQRDYIAVAERIRDNGGRCRIELIPEPRGSSFGSVPVVPTADPTVLHNAHLPLWGRLAELATDWMRS